MAAEEDSSSIEEVVAARQERLRALKAAHQQLNTHDDDDNQTQTQQEQEREQETETNTPMKFRNYVPHDEHLQKGKLAPPVLSKYPVSALVPPPSDKKEDPFVNIAPKKPNRELCRDVQKKLDKLERQTQKAMCKLMEQEKEKQQLDEDGTNSAGD